MRNIGARKDGGGAALLCGESCQEHGDCARRHTQWVWQGQRG